MKNDFLVIGSNSFSGAYFIKYLLEKGHNVTIIANDEFFDWDPRMVCDSIKLGQLFSIDSVLENIFGPNLR